MRRRDPLLTAGFVLAALSLVLGVLTAVPAIVIGILLIVRGRGGPGAAVIALAVALPLITAGVVFGVLGARAFRLPSESMEPAYEVGDRVITIDDSSPERGDVIVFNPPRGAIENICGVRHSPRSACPRPTPAETSVKFIRRVVALPGDRVSIRKGGVYLNGRRQAEPYARVGPDCITCDLPAEIQIPAGHVFTLGDNRALSADSREYGPVAADSIVGEVRFRYWPPAHFGSP